MRNKFMPIVLAVLMVLATIAPITVRAESNKTTNLTIHKLKYDSNLAADKKIKNDGTEKTYDASIVPYNADEYGEVGFTLYRLDTDKTLAKMKEEGGNAQALADKIAKDIDGNTTAGLITKVEVEEVKQSTGTDPIAMTVTTSSTEAEYFLLVETTSPGTVVEKSQPMLLQFPMRSADGKGSLDTVHLYPKNKVDESSREIEFNKVIEKVNSNGKPSNTVFQGAEFEVYKGKPGEGTKLMKDGNPVKLTSGQDGKFKLTGLTVGNYYLVEVPTAVVDSNDAEVEKSASKPFIVSPFAKNDTKNQFAFRMNEDGKIYRIIEWQGDNPDIKDTNLLEDGKFSFEITNLVKPSSSKKLTGKSESIGYGDILEYEIKVNLPATLGQKSIEDEKYEIVDTASEGVIIDESSIKIYDKNGKEVIRSKVTSEAISIEKIKDNQVKFIFRKNSFTPDKTGFVSGPFTIKYNAKISEDFVITEETKITNKIEGEYTVDGNVYPDPDDPVDPVDPVDPENPENPSPIPEDENKKETEVTSFVKNLKKVDSGIFETGAVKKPLADAEFILGRKVGDKVEYRKEDATDKYAWTENKEEAQIVKSGADGTFKFEGLASKTNDGTEITYFAEEVKAPENYKLPENEEDRKHEFTFTGENVELEITNNKSVDAPMTGYEKSVVAVGGLLVLLAIAYTVSRKTRKQVAAN